MSGSGSSVSIEVDAPRVVVFRTIADPTTYPDWLVGARAIRSVDADWPGEGSAFRHVIGFPPLFIPGSTTSKGVERDRSLELRAGMGPLGAAFVRFDLSDTASGGTRIEVAERFVAGPAQWSARLAGPVISALVWGRNAVSLDALADVLGRRVTSGPT
jgi:uncharacterized protein YndB with AHSA1/START domain